MSRTQSSIKNLTTALIGQAAGIIISFVARIVFLKYLNEEYLGLNGLFTNILTIFSLVELGVGSAMNFSLYKPLAENNISQIKSLMTLYRKAYIIVGCAIAIVGLIFTPFYTVFMDEVPNIPNLTLIYWLFTLNTVISYFFSYKRALIICDEKRYIATIYRYAFYFILNIVQIIVLIATHNYILFLAMQVIFTFAENVAISFKADKMYPYLKEKDYTPVSKESFAEIKKNIGAMIMHKIGGMVVISTDNLILSKFVGLTAVGLYSNYYLIIDALTKIISQVFTSVTASVGNLNSSSNEKGKLELIFDRLFFLNFWIYGFCTCCLWTLFNPFITLWLGENLVFDKFTVLIIVINFYLAGMRKTTLTFREATGAFYYDRYKPLIESAINIVVSIFLAKRIGTAGVFLGTIISTLATCIWIEPYILYKHVFKKSKRISKYLLKLLLYTVVTAFATVCTNNLCSLIDISGGIAEFIICVCICVAVPNVIFLLCFFRTESFGYFYALAVKTLKKAFHK